MMRFIRVEEHDHTVSLKGYCRLDVRGKRPEKGGQGSPERIKKPLGGGGEEQIVVKGTATIDE